MNSRAGIFLDVGAQLAEGPVWDDIRGELVWVDIPRGDVHRTSEDGTSDKVVHMGEHVGSVALTEDNGMLAATASGFRHVEPAGGHPLLAPLPDPRDGIRMNDGKCDPAGRFVAGTMAYDQRPGAGSLYSFDGQRVRQLCAEITVSNGLAWSADARTMYFVDTPTRNIDAFDYDVSTGDLAHRRTLLPLPDGIGDPDGITIDTGGGIWVALWGGGSVRRYADGTETHCVEVPAPLVTSVAIGGSGNDRLFITTARTEDGVGGQIYVALVDTGAHPVHRFRSVDAGNKARR